MKMVETVKKPFLIKKFLLLIVIFLFLALVPTLASASLIYLKPEGDRLYVAYENGVIEVWNTTSNALVKRISNNLFVLSAEKDNSNLYLGGDEGKLYIVDLESGLSTKLNITVTSSSISALSLDPSFQTLYLGCGGLSESALAVFNVKDGKVEKLINLGNISIQNIFLNGSIIYIISTTNLLIMDSQSFTLLKNYNVLTSDFKKALQQGGIVWGGIIEDNKAYLGYLYDKIRIWNLSNGKLIKEINTSPDSYEFRSMKSDEQYIYSAFIRGDKDVLVITKEGEVVVNLSANYTINLLEVTTDYLYAATIEGGILIYNKTNLNLIKKIGDFTLYEKEQQERENLSPQKPINPARPIFIAFAVIFIAAFLIEGYGHVKKESEAFSFSAIKKFLSSFIRAEDLLALLGVASGIILILGIINPSVVFPHYIANLKLIYYFDIFIKRGAFLLVWFLLFPTLAYLATGKRNWQIRLAACLAAFAIVVVIYIFAPSI